MGSLLSAAVETEMGKLFAPNVKQSVLRALTKESELMTSAETQKHIAQQVDAAEKTMKDPVMNNTVFGILARSGKWMKLSENMHARKRKHTMTSKRDEIKSSSNRDDDDDNDREVDIEAEQIVGNLEKETNELVKKIEEENKYDDDEAEQIVGNLKDGETG